MAKGVACGIRSEPCRPSGRGPDSGNERIRQRPISIRAGARRRGAIPKCCAHGFGCSCWCIRSGPRDCPAAEHGCRSADPDLTALLRIRRRPARTRETQSNRTATSSTGGISRRLEALPGNCNPLRSDQMSIRRRPAPLKPPRCTPACCRSSSSRQGQPAARRRLLRAFPSRRS